MRGVGSLTPPAGAGSLPDGMPSHSPLIRKCLAAGLVAAVLLATPLASLGADTATQLDRTRREISEIRKRLSAAKSDAAVIEREVKNLDRQIADLDRQIRTGEHDISELESDIRSAEARIAELESQYTSARESSKNRARRLYKNGPAESIARMMEARSIGEFIRMSVWW